MAIQTVSAIPGWMEKLDPYDERPYTEVFDGRCERKPVSPVFWHGQIQGRVGVTLSAWAKGRGRAGSEVRFFFLHSEDAPPSSLLPDQAYVSYERLPIDAPEPVVNKPRVAPALAIEIRSSNERRARINRKVELYLRYGTAVVLVIEPLKNRWEIHRPTRAVEAGELRGSILVPPFEGLIFDWDAILEGVVVPRRSAPKRGR